MFGWTGKVLRVDLNTGMVKTEVLDSETARKYIGGRGLNSYVLFQEIQAGIDPLGPDNVICFAPGPFTATGLTSSSRVEVSTLSPYSNILGDGNAGGHFATYMKRAGYDQIIVTGQSPTPVYLWIDQEKAELCDAGDLWDSTTWETTDILTERHGSDISVAAIGQAGENLVRYASTIFDKYNSAARGSGAVLGSKKLKAIAVRGKGKVPVAHSDEFANLAREDRDFFLQDEFQREVAAVYGSHIGMGRWYPGLRYYEKYLSEEEIPAELTPQAMKKFEVQRTACYGCAVPCKDVFRIPEGEYAGEIGKALEHECLFGLGTNCGITKPVPILVMENLADKYGMCVIALGNAIAFAKFLYHQGIITDEDTGGLKLEWEDDAAQIELIHQVALRQGFGRVIAEGMYSMAKIIGRGAMDYCYHVKGVSRGPHPAGVFGLAHATSTRGADHLRGRSWAFGENDPELWPRLIEQGYIKVDDPVTTLVLSERATTLTDMIGRCKGAVNNWASAVPLVHKYPLLDGVARLLSAATGMEFTEQEVARAADRVYLMEIAFNVRQGSGRKHDRLPLKPDMLNSQEGQEELRKHDDMLEKYYALRGCDLKTGVPCRPALENLGLEFVADDFDRYGPYADWDGPPLWGMDDYPTGSRRA